MGMEVKNALPQTYISILFRYHVVTWPSLKLCCKMCYSDHHTMFNTLNAVQFISLAVEGSTDIHC